MSNCLLFLLQLRCRGKQLACRLYEANFGAQATTAEENHSPRVQENSRLFGVILSGYAEGGRATAYPHYNGAAGASGRSRMGGRGCPAGRRTAVSQRKGVARIFLGFLGSGRMMARRSCRDLGSRYLANTRNSSAEQGHQLGKLGPTCEADYFLSTALSI